VARSNRWLVALLAALALPPGARPAAAQCMPTNPSFEIPGSGGAPFGGWTTFGPVSASNLAAHGNTSALVTGPNSGTWNVSGLWQSLTCTPGLAWGVSVYVQNSLAAPLSGGSQALLNVEWHDSTGAMISYESHVVATSSSPPGAWLYFSTQTGPAPAHTASIHLLVGVLQGPTDPTPQVLFDEVGCIQVQSPSHDSLQWSDFSSGRTLQFAGRTWRVKGPGYLGPGPNLFDNSSAAAWVDSAGQLNLTIHKIGSSWYSSEVALEDSLGYGDYVFTTRGHVDTLDPNAVFGLFIWEYGTCYDTSYLWWNPYNEVDVELSRWGYTNIPDAQFVAQPGSTGGNTYRFNVTMGDTDLVSFAFRWLPHEVDYRAWRGGPNDESGSTLLQSWTYRGDDQPRPESPRVHLNLWQLAAPASTQSVVVNGFSFRTACPGGDCGVLAVGTGPQPPASLAPAAPNPFSRSTTIRWTLAHAGRVELALYDVAGRRVRTLTDAALAGRPHVAAWDGLDDAGRPVLPGVYFARLRADGREQAQRVVVLK